MAKKKNNKKNNLASAIKKATTTIKKTAANSGAKTSTTKVQSAASVVKKAANKATSSAPVKTAQAANVVKQAAKKVAPEATKPKTNKAKPKTTKFGQAQRTNGQNMAKGLIKAGKNLNKDTYKTGSNAVAELVKGGTLVKLGGTGGDVYKDVVKQYKDAGVRMTDADKKRIQGEITKNVRDTYAEDAKKIQKALGEKTVKVEKLTKKERQKLWSAEAQTAVRPRDTANPGDLSNPVKEFLKKNPDIGKKLAGQETAFYVNNKAFAGAVEGLSPILVNNRDIKGYHTDQELAEIEKARQSKAYKNAYTAGTIGSFFIGGGGGAVESGIKSGIKGLMKVGSKKVLSEGVKNAGKTASKAVGKNAAKTVGKEELKNIVKKNLSKDVAKIVDAEIKQAGKSVTLEKIVNNTWNSLKLTGKDKAKSFAASRLADLAVSTPLNIADAAKQGTRANGDFDIKYAAKQFGISTAMDMALGGAVDGAGLLMKSGSYKKLSNIIAKQNAGERLSVDEQRFLDNIKAGAKHNNLTRRSAETLNKVRSDYKGTGVMKAYDDMAYASKKAYSNNTFKAVDNATEKAYNGEKGGTEYGNRQSGKTDISINTGRAADIRQADERISIGSKIDRERIDNSTRKEGLGRVGVGSRAVDTDTRTKMTNSGIVDTKLTGSDYAVFSEQLNKAISTNPHGGYVSPKTIDELTDKNAKTFLSDDGSAGVAVQSDGDIVGVFNTGTKYKGAVNDLVLTARANGGTKMDCYGARLVKKYEQAGFVPVARVPFNAEYVTDAVVLKNKPDVYIMMKNTDDIDTVINKAGKAEYDITSLDELESLPTFTDYDEALKYRDNLLAKQEKGIDMSPEEKALWDKELKTANNGKDWETVNKEINRIHDLKKEKQVLDHKIRNTSNSESYVEYLARREEIYAELDELYEKQGLHNVESPKKEVSEKADDLIAAAQGRYVEDLKGLRKHQSKSFESFMRLFVDSFRGFETYALKLPKEARLEMQSIINSVRNAQNKAGGWITEGRVNVHGKITGESFSDIFSELLKKKNKIKYEEFQYYVANKHNIDRYVEDKGVFGGKITAEDSVAICEELEKKYPDFADLQNSLNDYLEDLQQYRVDTGLISKTTKDYLDALYPNYVPTYRIENGKRVNIEGFNNSHSSIGTPIREAKGSNKDLLPLHEQIMNVTDYTLKMGEQNRLMKFIADAQGIDIKSIDPDVRIENAVEASTMAVETPTGSHLMTFYDNGEVRKVSLNEQMFFGIKEWRNDPDTLGAMFNWKAKPLRAANSLFKNLITGWNPIFGLTNIIKDTGEALIYTKDWRGFMASYPKAIAAVVGKKSKYSEYYKLYQAAGGRYAHIRDVMTSFDTKSIPRKVLESPISACQYFNDCLEAIPRMAEFISTVDKSLKSKGDDAATVLSKMDSKTIDKALMNANEVTLNFGRRGVIGKSLNNTLIPYLNPAIQGMDKLRRVFVEAGTDGFKGFVGLMGKIGAFAVTPAMFNELMMTFTDNEDYRNLNTRDKDNNFLIPMGDGEFIKIPMSRAGATLASPFTHFYRHAMYGDSMEWKELWQGAWNNIGVQNPLESSIFSPLLLAASNKTWYGGNIENATDLDLRKAGKKSEIYDERTSGIAIFVGGKLNMSPKKVDYIIDAYTGVIGDMLLPATTKSAKHNPFYSKFVIDSVFNNRLSTDFYEKNALMEAKSNVGNKKDKEKYENWKSEYMYDASTINMAIRDIDNDPSLSKSEKLQLKRELKKGLNKYYRAGIDGTKINIEPISFISKHIGVDKALSRYLPDSENSAYSFRDNYQVYKLSEGYKGKSKKERKSIANDFLGTYTLAVKTEKNIDVKYHSTPNWTTIAVVNAKRGGRDSIALSCGVYESQIDSAKNFIKYGGGLKEYINSSKRTNKTNANMLKNGIDTSNNLYKKNVKSAVNAMSLASSPLEFRDTSYYIAGCDTKMNAARGLYSKYKWTPREVAALGMLADSDKNTYYRKQEVVDAINNSKASSREEKAMLFNLLYGSKGNNPFGSIGDYSLSKDTGIKSESKKTSGGYGKSGGSRGKSKKTATDKEPKEPKSKVPLWEAFLKDYITVAEDLKRTKFDKWDSPMDSSYIKKINSILKKKIE